MTLLRVIDNWSGLGGKLIITNEKVLLKNGDNYISTGMSGNQNIFTFGLLYPEPTPRTEFKVVAVTSDLKWGYSGNNTLHKLPIIDL